MAQDQHQRAKERYEDACDAFRDQRVRMVEELEFSNPADPKQWTDAARAIRENGPDGSRPCLTLDRTNQYIAQVVNDARQNKPAPTFMPSSGGARQEVAKALNGIARHIEYQSRAQIAYDTAIEHAARASLGWMRVVTEVCNAELNHQEIRIKRVHDPLSVVCDPDWTEPDGSDIQYGFVESWYSPGAFKRAWPKAKAENWTQAESGGGWRGDDSILVCEHFDLRKKKESMLVVRTQDGVKRTMTEDQYWALVKAEGYQPEFLSQYQGETQEVVWLKMSGADILEETIFPSRFIPLVPVIGHEIWIEGKRYLSGMTRRMMEAQRAYNYERSAWVEAVALQPRAPVFADAESVAGHEDTWARMNRANLAFLPYNSVADDGRPLAAPQRLNPPTMPAAFAQGAQFANDDLQSSVGMFNAALGKQSNETSGIAIRRRDQQSDTANFHYVDNLGRSIEHLWRIVIDMIPRLYDEPREARILGEDGSVKSVIIDPTGDAYTEREDGSATINLGTGTYDVRVKTGPAYTTLRQEASENLGQIIQGNPQLAAVVAPIWARMQDWPESDKLSKALMAMAPPQVQAAMSDEGAKADPEALKQQLMQQQQQMEQMQQMMKQMGQALDEAAKKESDQQAKTEIDAYKAQIDAYKAETERMSALAPAMDPMQVQAIVAQTLQQLMTPQDISYPPPEHEPPGMEMPEQYEQPEPPEGGFFTPEDQAMQPAE